jgi:hypothetical protein
MQMAPLSVGNRNRKEKKYYEDVLHVRALGFE